MKDKSVRVVQSTHTDNCKSCEQSDHSNQGHQIDQSGQSDKTLKNVVLWMFLKYAVFNGDITSFCGLVVQTVGNRGKYVLYTIENK